MEGASNQMLVTGPAMFQVLSLLKYLKKRCPKGSVVYIDPSTFAIHYKKEI